MVRPNVSFSDLAATGLGSGPVGGVMGVRAGGPAPLWIYFHIGHRILDIHLHTYIYIYVYIYITYCTDTGTYIYIYI